MDLKERRENMQSFFDRKADGYDDVHVNFLQSKNAITDALDEGTKMVLDLGIGTGLELIRLFERFPTAKVTGIDVSPKMLEQLERLPFYDSITAVCADFFEVEFGQGLDAVISTSALHHFTPQHKAVLYKKVYDALRPGGLFINADKTVPDDAEEEKWFKIYEEEKELRAHIDTPLTPRHEEQLLRGAGFAGISCAPLNNPGYYLTSARKPE